MKNKKETITILTALFFILLLTLSSFYLSSSQKIKNIFPIRNESSSKTQILTSITKTKEDQIVKKIIEAEVNGKNFLINKMMSKNGAIYSTFKKGYPSSLLYGVNHEITAESVGLALIYAVKSEDKHLFELEYNFVKNYLIGTYNVCYWKLNEDLSPFIHEGYACSASIDDLRIIEALILGYEKWKNIEYLNLAKQIMNGVYKNEVNQRGLFLVDWFCWNKGGVIKSQGLTLYYAKFSSLKKIKEYDSNWEAIFNKTLQKVLNGKIKNSPLFFEAYDAYKGYRNAKMYVSSINQILIGINLIDAEQFEEAKKVYEFFKEEYNLKGYISDSYDPLTRKASGIKAGIGAYSLLARLAIKIGDVQFALKVILEKILPMQVNDSSSVYYGGFLNQWPSEIFDANSYDNLQALITLRTLITYFESIN